MLDPPEEDDDEDYEEVKHRDTNFKKEVHLEGHEDIEENHKDELGEIRDGLTKHFRSDYYEEKERV